MLTLDAIPLFRPNSERRHPAGSDAAPEGPPSLGALAACKLKLYFDFYGPPAISELALHFLANCLAQRLRECQIGLSGRAAAALKRAKVGVEGRHFKSMLLPRYFDSGTRHSRTTDANGPHHLVKMSWLLPR